MVFFEMPSVRSSAKVKTHATTFRKLVSSSRRVLLISDQRADGDSLGCVKALCVLLDRMQKKHTVLVAESIPETLSFLTPRHLVLGVHHLDFSAYDLVIGCDFGNTYQSGVAAELAEAKKSGHPTVISIDHHETHEMFGHVNITDSEYGSATMIVYELLKFSGWECDRVMADALLAGILFDTNNFSNRATSARAFLIASELVAAGAQMGFLTRSFFRTKSLASLKLWARAFDRIAVCPGVDIASTGVTEQDMRECGAREGATEGLVNFLSSAAETSAVMFAHERTGVVRASLRTTRDDVNLRALAEFLGGGGHRRASAFRVPGVMKYAKDRIRVE